MSLPIVGVDPGGTNTGIVARYGDILISHVLLTRGPERPGAQSDYRGMVLDEIAYAYGRARDATGYQTPVVALEKVQAPNPHVRMTNVDGLLRTAEVIGWVQEHAAASGWRLAMVPPGGHGSAPLRAYPAKLVGPQEKAGTGKRRHLRSAWDIAFAAGQLIVRDPSLVTTSSKSVESTVMDEPGDIQEQAKTTPADVSRMVRRVRLGREALTRALGDCVRACAASGYSAKDIVEGDGSDDKLSRQRVYQMLKGDDPEETT